MKNRQLFLDLPRISHLCHVSKKNKSVVLLSSLHHDSAICRDSEKPDITEFYNKTKGSADLLDQICARHTVQRAIRRWTMAMFYGMISSAVNALIVQGGSNMTGTDFFFFCNHICSSLYQLPDRTEQVLTRAGGRVASLVQGRTAAAQYGLFTHKSVPVIFEPPCICTQHAQRSA